MSLAAESAEAGESEESGSVLKRLAHSLHEICQPLTALQCRLEIEQMEREDGAGSEEPAEREDRTGRTLADCLRECDRMNERVTTMRALLRRALMHEKEGHA